MPLFLSTPRIIKHSSTVTLHRERTQLALRGGVTSARVLLAPDASENRGECLALEGCARMRIADREHADDDACQGDAQVG